MSMLLVGKHICGFLLPSMGYTVVAKSAYATIIQLKRSVLVGAIYRRITYPVKAVMYVNIRIELVMF